MKIVAYQKYRNMCVYIFVHIYFENGLKIAIRCVFLIVRSVINYCFSRTILNHSFKKKKPVVF